MLLTRRSTVSLLSSISMLLVLCALYPRDIEATAAAQRMTQPDPCNSRLNCSSCLQVSVCAWCASPPVSDHHKTIVRCNRHSWFVNGHVTCNASHLITLDNHVLLTRNTNLSIDSSVRNKQNHEQKHKQKQQQQIVQLMPQRVQLKLRANKPLSLPFAFALDPNQPIDLYYLMDMSNSMRDDKESLSRLGRLLADNMRRLTTNFRLGFGTFVDKVLMPYVSYLENFVLNTCRECEEPYSFKNRMRLSSNADLFANSVNVTKISGNLDAPEGGFDALMQVMVCEKEIGWRHNSRHVIVYSSDASFHYAGDGKLAGVIKPNDGRCHLDPEGSYTHAHVQDYPSVGQISQKAAQHSMNLIFAVTKNNNETYTALSELMEASSVGILEADSSNVVSLIEQQYNAITSKVSMSASTSEYVHVKFLTNCGNEGQQVQPTNVCNDVKIGQKINFTAEIELLKCPVNPEQWREVIEIKPIGLNESLIVEILMQCECDCDKPGNPGYIENSEHCSSHGVMQCGRCNCNSSHYGSQCQCSFDDIVHAPLSAWGGAKQGDTVSTTLLMQQKCRSPNTSSTDGQLCSGRGTCHCGTCQCDVRDTPGEVVTGEYCECDNFSCARHRNRVCSGAEHGVCECGTCVCARGWTGEACECPTSTKMCHAPGDKQQCSGNGECRCGKCACKETEDGRYSGQYCEDCPTCKGRCDEFRDCVDCTVFRTGPLHSAAQGAEGTVSVMCRDDCGHLNITQSDTVEVETLDQILCTFSDEDSCHYRFVYDYYGAQRQPRIAAQSRKQCPPALDIFAIVLTLIAAIVVVGVALLFLWKLLTTIHDRREYAKWDSERKMAKWETGENPIYKQATSTYKNPVYGAK